VIPFSHRTGGPYRHVGVRSPGTAVVATEVRSTFTARDVALLVALGLMWGCSFLFIKVAVDTVAPLWIVAVRCVIGAAMLLAILRVRGTRLPRGLAIWRDLTLLAALGNAIPWGLMAWATQFLPSGLVAVVNALAPTSTLLIAMLVRVERASVRRFLGLLVALSGTALAVSGDLGTPGTVMAAAAIVLATIAYGGGTVYAKQRVSGHHSPLAIATGQVLAAAVLSIPVAAMFAPFPDVTAVPLTAIAALVALGVFGTGLAFLAFYALIEGVGATSAVMVTYLIPIVALLAGALVLGEALTVVVLVGTALTIGGVWLAQRERAPTVVGQLQEAPR
jgi:drug/metabolite transporter (DMT)-like permease